MTRESIHPDSPQPSDLTPDQLVRLAADDELTPESRAAFERLRAADPLVDARVETERALRSAVSRIMGQAKAPAGLADRLRAAMAQEGSTETQASTGIDSASAHDADPIPFQAPTASPTVVRSWQRPWWLGVAAGFLLAAGVMLVVSPWSLPTSSQNAGTNQGIFSTTNLVSYVEEQHTSCANLGAIFERKMTYRDRADAERAAIELLQVIPNVFDLRAGELQDKGYRFAGLGRCKIPGDGASAHLMYASTDESLPPISLWIQKDTGEWNDRIAQLGACYSVGLCKERGTSLSVWREDGLVYFLYSRDQDLESSAREAFDAPVVAGTI